MTTITREEAVQDLQPFAEDFVRVFKSAWGDWLASPIAAQMQHKRVRANYVWNQLIAHAKVVLDQKAGISISKVRDWEGVLLGDRIFIRMKKASSNLLSRNYPTQLALAFHNPQKELIKGVARLEMLYVLTPDETSLDRIVLVQRDKRRIDWQWDLLEAENPLAQNIIPFDHSQDPRPVAKRIVKSKKQKVKKDVGTGKVGGKGDVST